MNARISSIALLTVALSYTALAQQSPMRPGNWEVTMKMSMQGMDMPPMKHTRCVTAEMLKDPQASIPQGPGSNDCKMTDYKLSGSTATYKMTCTKPTLTNITGEMKYSGDSTYTGTIQMETSGQTMSMTMDGKWVGECPK